MELNDFIEIQTTVAPAQAPKEPTVNRQEQVNIGLDYAKRQAETPEQKPIPSAGATPIAN